MAKGRNSFGGGFPGMGGGNLNQLMKQAQKMQQDMQQAQAELQAVEIEHSVGGGMVSVRINGEHKVLDLKINPEAVDPEDVEMLQDMILAAINGAEDKLSELSEEKMGKYANLGGMGF